MNANIRYSIVIPVYNEEAVINQTYQRLKQEIALGINYIGSRLRIFSPISL